MTYQQLKDLNKNRELKQVAFVTSDIDKAVKQWVDILGIGPWEIIEFSDKTLRDFKVGGVLVEGPFKFIVALCDVGHMNIEIIQPVYGTTIYQSFIDRHGEGMHHIKEKISCEKLDKTLKKYADMGITVLQTGWYRNDVHYYLGTETVLDFIFEIGNCPIIDLDPDSVRYYPPKEEVVENE